MSVDCQIERLVLLSGSNYFTMTVVTGTIPLSTETSGSIARSVDGGLWRSYGGGTWGPLGGLYAPSMSRYPTSGSTGLTTWFNQPAGVTYTTGSQGFTVFEPSKGGVNNPGLLTKAAPTTPYSIKILVACVATPLVLAATAFGYASGSAFATAPLQIMFWAPNASGNLEVINYNANGSFNSTPYNANGLYGGTIWLRVRDDGTTVSYASSPSGDDDQFFTHYSTTKASSFLGPNGYNQIVFGAFGLNGDVYAKMMAWVQTNS